MPAETIFEKAQSKTGDQTVPGVLNPDTRVEITFDPVLDKVANLLIMSSSDSDLNMYKSIVSSDSTTETRDNSFTTLDAV